MVPTPLPEVVAPGPDRRAGHRPVIHCPPSEPGPWALPWLDAVRDHRRRAGGQPGGHPRRPIGRGRHPHRAGCGGGSRQPLGLHPVQGDDRHRWGHVLPPANRRHGGGGCGWGGRPRAAPGPDHQHRRAPRTDQRADPAKPAGVRWCAARAAWSALTPSWPTPPTGRSSFEADAVLLSTGSRPRIPRWADLDGDRLLTTRDAYPPNVLPEHLVVIGSGVTGVEFVHMFASLGCEVTLIVSRQQVLPQKDPEVAAVLEADFTRRGVRLLKGARATGVDQGARGVVVRCDDGRVVHGTHALLAIGSVPNSEGLGLEPAGVDVAGDRLPPDQPTLSDQCAAHLRRRRRVRKAPAVVSGSHAGPQGGRVRGGRSHRLPPPSELRQVPRRPSSPSPRSPTWAWPRPTPSPRGARSG